MDQINIIIGLAVLFLIGTGAIIALIRRVKELEDSLEHKTTSASFYSKESLNRFEEISQLRMKLLSLQQDKSKLQEEVAALKAGIKVINDRATALTAELEATKATKEVTSEVVEETITPAATLSAPTTISVSSTQAPLRSGNKNKRKK
jgi:predicted nuclease with TOPRIM domain